MSPICMPADCTRFTVILPSFLFLGLLLLPLFFPPFSSIKEKWASLVRLQDGGLVLWWLVLRRSLTGILMSDLKEMSGCVTTSTSSATSAQVVGLQQWKRGMWQRVLRHCDCQLAAQRHAEGGKRSAPFPTFADGRNPHSHQHQVEHDIGLLVPCPLEFL